MFDDGSTSGASIAYLSNIEVFEVGGTAAKVSCVEEVTRYRAKAGASVALLSSIELPYSTNVSQDRGS